VRYIRYLMRCGECDHDQLVSRLCSEPWLGQMLSEAEADAVVTAAMAEAGQ
jgi:hypothetical protein